MLWKKKMKRRLPKAGTQTGLCAHLGRIETDVTVDGPTFCAELDFYV